MKKGLVVLSLTAAVVGCSMMKTKSKVTSDFTKSNATYSLNKSTYTNGKKIVAKKSKGRSLASQDGLTPNGIRYRENGGKPETGKSGLRQIQSWGLRNKDGNTTVYISTGNVQAGTVEAGTHITKVQMKSKNASGDVLLNKEFNQLTNDGTFSFTTNLLARSQKYDLMSHVSKDGEKRNFVVTTSNQVYLLPDIKVERVENNAQAFINERVLITGLIREINGDIGAAADCVLYVDGVEVERAPSIWIDTTDTVACQFARQFDSLGDKALTIKAENVNPTDYDLANNEATSTIKIVNNSIPLRSYYAQFYDFKTKYHYKYQNNYYGDAGTINYDQDYQGAYYQGYINELIPNVPWTVSVSETTGGQTITPFESKTLTNCNQYNYDAENYYRQCWEHDYANNQYISVYSQKYYGSTQSWVYYNRYWYRTVYYGASGSYSYYNGVIEEYGTQQFATTGNDWRVQVGLEANGISYVADKTVGPTPYNYSYNQPWYCYYYYGGQQYCYEYDYTQTGKQFYQYFGE